MEKIYLEYIWLDGSEPQQLRSKTKVVDRCKPSGSQPNWNDIESFSDWSFDGSSTGQAKAGKGENTDCILKPVYSVTDPFRGYPHRLVLCEVFNPDGVNPHPTNKRAQLRELLSELGINDAVEEKYSLPWFGWEQEYTLTVKDGVTQHAFGKGEGAPLGHLDGPVGQTPREQGDYYCGVGSDNVAGRAIAERHMNVCSGIGIDISGINAEVMLGQWEYQVGPVTPLNGSDQLWMSRYILQRVAENHNVKISIHPKPLSGNWNGSGCHVNFSTKEMREDGGISLIERAMESLKKAHNEHIEVYGLENDKRMTGEHETSSIHDFSYGYSTRDTSIRIPVQAKIDGRGYFEDRRPASNCDPYLVSHRMLKTVLQEA
jgi:glutamine synthetase